MAEQSHATAALHIFTNAKKCTHRKYFLPKIKIRRFIPKLMSELIRSWDFRQSMHEASCAFIAAGANRHPEAADVETQSGLVAFGSGRNIALWNPCSEKARTGIKALLSGHTDVVNVVKFLPLGHGCNSILLSGSADSKIRVWRKTLNKSGASLPGDSSQTYSCYKTLHSHAKSINTIAVLPQYHLFVSGAADSELNVWRCNVQDDTLEVDLLQTVSLAPKYFPLCLALSSLPASNAVVLAVAGSRTSVQIFVSHHHGNDFEIKATLSGHEGWIRSLDFCVDMESTSGFENDLLLASASQDKYIRLWRCRKGKSLPVATKATNDPLLGFFGASLSNKAHRFETGGEQYSITFEALLVGHEDWIYNARWCGSGGGLRLLSASADNSLAIWQPDEGSSVWTCTVRLGEISAQKGATTATGSTGGFWIGLWHDEGRAVLSLGRTGGWRLWAYASEQDLWTQHSAVGGHTKAVVGLTWAKDGSYMLSTSTDQTTRMYAPIEVDGVQSWHEFARPQIHGYDLNCIDTINNGQFISGADEKLLRVFDEPKAVAELMSAVCGIAPVSDKPLPEAANIPVLGLSNKVIDIQETNGDTENNDSYATEQTEELLPQDQLLSHLDGPPLEDHLARHLLWPETEKLYGHGYEISAVASSRDGKIVATACRASSIDHAVIRLFQTSDWREVKPNLSLHSLTVTRLQFSPDDAYLLSIGRDRQCALFSRLAEGSSSYSLVVSNPKAHTRMLLDASWAPLDAGRVFATAGRDKMVHIWKLSDGQLIKCAAIPGPGPVAAVAFLPRVCEQHLLLACGFDDGTILIRNVANENLSLSQGVVQLRQELLPSGSITQLSWRPSRGYGQRDDSDIWQLAIASEDYSVRILNVNVTNVLGRT